MVYAAGIPKWTIAMIRAMRYSLMEMEKQVEIFVLLKIQYK